ncbi:Origin recognition complex subunit 3 [Purpureocillium takamizusanense]|uniref:Origin recognition complex subunit 3 n=1 Tax=Purpureocillium takamizusanense TaxID=2060973 RepID=A0A9Q8Q8M6_9HYPO|nr:Origin recognition complex subunit 3 [Purpureocillium takamizusanense]UNI15075.1 Origin recognition complex subunit 3 [Purpureocillium takamizusanense]
MQSRPSLLATVPLHTERAMGPDEQARDTFAQEDHQVAYVFDPDDGETHRERPSKRRRVSKQTKRTSAASEAEPLFVPLLNGKESAACVRLRQRLYEESWAKVDARLQGMLRESNLATLEQVTAFVAAAGSECDDQIPAAFIITGPNIASQDLLFEQLSETLQLVSASRFVRLRSAEAASLKAALKRTIRGAAASAGGGDDDEDSLQVGTGQDGRKYLDYDLEALEASIRAQPCEHVYVAFQDSESFDSGLISDLITLFHSWRPRIPFTLLFGIATSVELLQARLLKSACRLVYGAQFDCVQTEAILETLFRGAVAACDVPLRLGAPLLRGMLDRQHDQIAGVQAFVSSLKYAYMCHFYANPLSISTSLEAPQADAVQPEHMDALRTLPSFRSHVERAVELGDESSLRHARSLLEDDEYLLARLQDSNEDRRRWVERLLRALLVREAAGAQRGVFSRAYVNAMADGVDTSEESGVAESIRRMSVEELSVLLRRALGLLTEGDPRLNLAPASDDADLRLQTALRAHAAELEALRETAQSQGFTLRSKYSGQSKVMRTTVIAQRVQLSQDSAALRDEDKRLTEIVDDVARLVATHFGVTGPGDVLFSEGWTYESRSPAREVFVPRPRAAFERSLGRPHDYLGCSCCAPSEGGIQATLPATAVLYQLYLETGSLINVADLWAAFDALVSGGDGDGDNSNKVAAGADEAGHDAEATGERERLVMFYRGLAELRALGYVKASKKKPDHVAKVKWL